MGEGGIEWLVDMEISLVKALGWSLHDIDATDMCSLLRFVDRMGGGGGNSRRVYADQVNWL